jgi:hypothetical protein
MFLYSNWLTDKVANNVPLDKMIQEILSGRRAARSARRKRTTIRSNATL